MYIYKGNELNVIVTNLLLLLKGTYYCGKPVTNWLLYEYTVYSMGVECMSGNYISEFIFLYISKLYTPYTCCSPSPN